MTTTLVTGANKGIGYETARQLTALGHTVYLGARDEDKGSKAAASIGARHVLLDVTNEESVQAALSVIASEEGRLDLVINNAGVLETGLNAAAAHRSFETNAVGVVRVTEAALPLLLRSSDPRVVTVSSSMGSFWAVTNPDRAESEMPLALYAASKAAATMLMVQYAKAHPDISFLAVEPGTTATDMTAPFGIGRPVSDSAAVVVRLATQDRIAPNGALVDELGTLPW